MLITWPWWGLSGYWPISLSSHYAEQNHKLNAEMAEFREDVATLYLLSLPILSFAPR
jgi:hypothetical protein